MRLGLAYRPLHHAVASCLGDSTSSYVSLLTSNRTIAVYLPSVADGQGHYGQGRRSATPPTASWAAWLTAIATIAHGTCNADTSSRQSLLPTAGAPGTVPGGSGAGGEQATTLTNHPLEYDPVTNEHTAKMTLARTAALEFYNAGKYTQAEAKFREAVAEAQLGFELHDPHIASAKNNLAEFLRNTGRWDEAEALYKEALDLLERNFGEKHWLFVAALHNLALSYEARGDLAAARAAMERVLALRLSMFGPRHFLYADSLFGLGHMLRAVPDQKDRGLRMMSEAVRVLEEAEKVQVNVVIYWLTEIANAHTADGQPELAATTLRRAVAHMATEQGEEAAAASALNEQLTDALAVGGRPEEAAEAALAALAARRKMFGDTALVVAQTEMRVAQLLAVTHSRDRMATATPSLQQPGFEGLSAVLRALQHAEAAARICIATVDECSRGGLLSGPQPDKLLKRLRASHTLGSAAKLVATLAGVGNPAATAATTSSTSSDSRSSSAMNGCESTSPKTMATAPQSNSRTWSWWPFSGKEGAKFPPAATANEIPTASKPAPQVPLPPREPVAELALADRRLEQAAAALVGATQAGRQLLQAVGSGRRQLPQGVTADELATLLVEAQLQLLDVLERLGLVLQARVAAGQGAAAGAAGFGSSSDVVERHRRVLEQQENVAAELLA